MIWQDLMLDRWADEAALRAAAAAAFDVPEEAVAVVNNPEQLAATSGSVRIILERHCQHRDFPLQLLVILRDDGLVTRFDGFEGILHIAREFAARLDATVLFAEGPLAPSAWVRVRPTGSVDLVSLDVDETGDVDSYFVVAEHELPAERQAGTPPTARLTA